MAEKKTTKVVLYAKALRARHDADVGEAVDVDADLAKGYIQAGVARPVKSTGRSTATKGPGEDASLNSRTKAELIELAEERGVEVTRGDGKDGDPLKADYVRALSG